MAKQMNRGGGGGGVGEGGRFAFNETHLQKIFFSKLKNYEIKLKKNEHRNNALNSLKKSKKAYTTGQNCFIGIIQ